MSDLSSCEESDEDQGHKISFAQMKAGAAKMKLTAECDVCRKTVYEANQFKVDSAILHKSCFKCCECKCSLTLKTFKRMSGKYYCGTHYPKSKHSSAMDQTTQNALDAPSAEKGRGFATFKKTDPNQLRKEKEEQARIDQNSMSWEEKRKAKLAADKGKLEQDAAEAARQTEESRAARAADEARERQERQARMDERRQREQDDNESRAKAAEDRAAAQQKLMEEERANRQAQAAEVNKEWTPPPRAAPTPAAPRPAPTPAPRPAPTPAAAPPRPAPTPAAAPPRPAPTPAPRASPPMPAAAPPRPSPPVPAAAPPRPAPTPPTPAAAPPRPSPAVPPARPGGAPPSGPGGPPPRGPGGPPPRPGGPPAGGPPPRLPGGAPPRPGGPPAGGPPPRGPGGPPPRPAAPQWPVGLECQAKYAADGMFYPARIDIDNGDGTFVITYTEYLEQATVSIADLKK